jgi:predicted phosphoribosyltransferase
MRFRGSKQYHLQSKTIILIDDGISTGATIFAAIQWLRNQKPKRVHKVIRQP